MQNLFLQSFFILLILASHAKANQNMELAPAEQMTEMLEAELQPEDLEELQNLEQELSLQEDHAFRDVLINEMLPDRRRRSFVCFAQNFRGHWFRAIGRHPRMVQHRAMRNCHYYSYRCYAQGCRVLRARRGPGDHWGPNRGRRGGRR
tara:strand:- start:8032 stop:8475 length:444 start_codon:yes stop_codon:yes gene_type:complete